MKPWTGYTVVVHLHKMLLARMMEETYPGVKTGDSSYIGQCKKLSSRWYGEQAETLQAEWKKQQHLGTWMLHHLRSNKSK